MRQNIKITVDAVIFSLKEGISYILLVQRLNAPFKNYMALPGGFVEDNEDLETAARRELKEETGIEAEQLKQLGTFGKPNRDPRGRTVTVAFTGQVDFQNPTASSDAKKANWYPTNQLPPLAFDHPEIISEALNNRDL